jgi:hypothetical protein
MSEATVGPSGDSSPGGYGMRLRPEHQELLRASAISPEVAQARGYTSVTEQSVLKGKGFSKPQCRVPALLIPIHGTTGEVVGYECRPNTPRMTDAGRVLKYEKPAGCSNRLDVPPAVLPALRDPSVQLFITEGARKVDAAVTAGLACVGLSGVYGWRYTDRDTGAKVALGDFEDVALNDREVVIAFDSDVMTKPEVRKALSRFRAFLESRGARTLVCVPPGDDGKVGLDDYLAAGGTRETLQSLAVPSLPDISGAIEPAGNGQSGIAPDLSEGDGTATLTDVARAFQERLELTDLDALYATLGTKAALALPGDPVWLLVIDGSSGGKTELVMPLNALPDVHLCAVLTEAALLSGTSRKEQAENATGGVLRQVGSHGVILMKDFTSVLSMQRDTRAQTLSALREVHDGSWDRPVGTDGGQVLRWAGKCTVIAGCTEAWDTAHAVVSMMGDRFLCVRPQHKSRERFGGRALGGAGDEIEVRAALAQSVRSLFNTPFGLPLSIPDEGLLVQVADLVTLARSPIQRDGRGELVLVLAPEMPGRFVKALAGLWNGLTALGADTETAWRVVMRVAFDSMPRIRRRVLEVLAGSIDWVYTSEARSEARLPRTTAVRALEDLHAHGVIDREGGKAPKGDKWRLTGHYLDVWERGHATPVQTPSDISGAIDGAVDDREQALLDAFPGSRVVGSYPNGDTIPDEYGGGTWGDMPTWARQPAEALEHNVRLGAPARERYRVGDKVKTKPLAHVWVTCDRCGEGVMRKKGDGPKRCVMTPGCEGTHRP